MAGVWGACSARDPEPEDCDNVDDDCDGGIDEGLIRDCSNICGAGTENCVAGSWRNCDAPVGELEVCDGIDNDCDGAVDESDPLVDSGMTCGSTIGVCTEGVYVCVAGELQCSGTNPSPELCNSLDDDCDGFTDEDLTQPCNNGLCTGFEVCSAGSWGSWPTSRLTGTASATASVRSRASLRRPAPCRTCDCWASQSGSASASSSRRVAL